MPITTSKHRISVSGEGMDRTRDASHARHQVAVSMTVCAKDERPEVRQLHAVSVHICPCLPRWAAALKSRIAKGNGERL